MTYLSYAIQPLRVEQTTDNAPLPVLLYESAGEDLKRAARYAAEAKSAGTTRAYRIDWDAFEAYCKTNALTALPAQPETIAAYCAHAIDHLKISTLRRRLVAISQMHKRAGFTSPTAHEAVRESMKGIARDEDVQQRSRKVKKTAITTELLSQAMMALDRTTLAGKRNAALLLLGFCAALRRSELVALDVEDLAFDARGLVVTIRRSKTDQDGNGAQIDVPIVKNRGLCAVRALQAWLAAAKIDGGPVFRSFGLDHMLKTTRLGDRDVALIIKRVTRAAGMEGDFSGHSLRRGYVTTGIRRGIAAIALMQRTRHRSLAVFQGYVDEARLFIDNPLQEMLA